MTKRACGKEIKKQGFGKHLTSCKVCQRQQPEKKTEKAPPISTRLQQQQIAAMYGRRNSEPNTRSLVEPAENINERTKMKQELQRLTAQVVHLQAQVNAMKEQLDAQSKELNRKATTEEVKDLDSKMSKNITNITSTPRNRSQNPQDPYTELVIRGLPYTGQDEKLDDILTKMAHKQNVTLSGRARIFRALRKGDKKVNKSRPPKVIIQLSSNADKNDMKRRPATPFTLEDLGYDHKELTPEQKQKPFYLNENLTPDQGKLFFEARKFKRANNYKFCWTSNGVILLRKAEGEAVYTVQSEQNLNQLREDRCGVGGPPGEY